MHDEKLLWEIGQRFVTGFPGTTMDAAFIEEVKRWKIGNIILFSRNLANHQQIAELCDSITRLIKAETGVIPFIMIDQEGGMITRLPKDCANAPGAMALAALDDDHAVYVSALETARELRKLGCNVNLAPVLDVNTNAKNPVIGVRSYSSDPQEVIRFSKQAIKGYEDGGVLCCGKHFPGHGDTSLDSHLSLPLVDKKKEELEAQLSPFREAVKQNIPAIMSSHVLFPAFEKEQLPCTMSRSIITGLLRGEFHYDGLVFSDCMEMQAIASYYGTTQGCLKALHAGIDQVLVSHTVSRAVEAMEAVEKDVRDGKFNQAEWKASLARIAKAKDKLTKTTPVDPSPDATAVLNNYAEEAITLVSGPLPPLSGDLLFIAPAAFITANIQDKLDVVDYAHALSSRLGGEALVISADPPEIEIADVVRKARGKHCYLGTYNGHLQRGQIDLAKALIAAGIPLVVTALRNPYDLAELKASCPTIAAWEYSPRVFEALGDIYQGKRTMGTKLPVSWE